MCGMKKIQPSNEVAVLERRETVAAIRVGIAAAEEGRVKLARRALVELQKKIGIRNATAVSFRR